MTAIYRTCGNVFRSLRHVLDSRPRTAMRNQFATGSTVRWAATGMPGRGGVATGTDSEEGRSNDGPFSRGSLAGILAIRSTVQRRRLSSKRNHPHPRSLRCDGTDRSEPAESPGSRQPAHRMDLGPGCRPLPSARMPAGNGRYVPPGAGTRLNHPQTIPQRLHSLAKKRMIKNVLSVDIIPRPQRWQQKEGFFSLASWNPR